MQVEGGRTNTVNTYLEAISRSSCWLDLFYSSASHTHHQKDKSKEEPRNTQSYTPKMSRSLPPAGGIYVPVPTFFVSKSASTYSSTMPPLDLEAQAAHSIHLAKSGCRGLVLLGSTGEAVHLTRAERVSQISYVRQALEAAGFKDYPLIAGTATNGIEETVQLLAEAKEAGAGWGLVLAPGYFAGAADQAGIRGWFEAVADESPIPVMMLVCSFLQPLNWIIISVWLLILSCG